MDRTKPTACSTEDEHFLSGDCFDPEFKGHTPAERLAARRARATPILAELRALLDETMAKISDKKVLPAPSATPWREAPL